MTAVDLALDPRRNFGAFRVLGSSIAIFFRHIIAFTLVAAGIWLPQIVVVAGLALIAGLGPQNLQRLDQNVVISLLTIANIAIPLLTFIFYPAAAATILFATFQHMHDGKVRIWTAIKRGFARVFWVILLLLLITLAIAAVVGLLSWLLTMSVASSSPLVALVPVIPAVYLGIIWFLAIPACVVERTGPIRSLIRSYGLTQGHRWRILGLFILAAIVMLVVGGVVMWLAVSLIPAVPVAGAIVVFLLMCFFMAFWSILPAVAYHDMRLAKEGVEIEKIAAVFD